MNGDQQMLGAAVKGSRVATMSHRGEVTLGIKHYYLWHSCLSTFTYWNIINTCIIYIR